MSKTWGRGSIYCNARNLVTMFYLKFYYHIYINILSVRPSVRPVVSRRRPPLSVRPSVRPSRRPSRRRLSCRRSSSLCPSVACCRHSNTILADVYKTSMKLIMCLQNIVFVLKQILCSILLANLGYQVFITRCCLPDPGYLILAARSWLTDPGYQILAIRSCLQDRG